MEIVRKAMLMRLLFSRLNVLAVTHLALWQMRNRLREFLIASSQTSCSEMENEKSNADAIAFLTAKCVAGNTFSSLSQSQI